MEKIAPGFLKKWNKLIILLLLGVFGFLVYANTLKGDFIWDDDILIKNNPAVKDVSKVLDLFTQDMGGQDSGYGFYRPLTMATYSIDYAVGKLNVGMYHLTNIFLHILAAFSLYLLVNLLFKNNPAALFTAILFILHPVHTEAVSYMSGRVDPLVAIFILLGFSFYIKYLESKSKLSYCVVLIMFALALLSKENSIIFPALLLLYHYAFKKDLKIKTLVPVFGVAFFYLIVRLTLLKSSLPHTKIEQCDILARIPGFFAGIANYIRILFLPFNLHFDYGNYAFRVYDYRVIIGLAATVFLISYAFLNRNRKRLLFFSICWFFIALLPTSSIYPICAFYMAEHWLYLPSIGFFMIIAKSLGDLYCVKRFKMLALVSMLGIALFYSYLTIAQNNYWRDPVIFYKRILKYSPGNQRIYYDLGNTYQNLGRNIEAMKVYKQALEKNPENYLIYNSLGNVYYSLGNYSEAIAMYTKGIEIKPDYDRLYFNLALAYHAIGDNASAIEYCNKAISLGYKAGVEFLKHLEADR